MTSKPETQHPTPKAYFIFREDLALPAPKLAVQVGHGVDRIWQNAACDIEAFAAWLDRSQGDRRKVLLRIKGESQLLKLREELDAEGFISFEIVDSGYNLVAPGTVTGLVLFPTARTCRQLKRLQALR